MADFIEYVWLSSINNWKIGFGGNAGFFSVIYINSMSIASVQEEKYFIPYSVYDCKGCSLIYFTYMY